MLIERSFETARISVMKGSRGALVKVVLFQLRGPVHPQNNTTPNFSLDSKGSLLDLLNEVSFVSEFFRKGN